MSGTQINDKSAVVANNTNNKQRETRAEQEPSAVARQSHSPTYSLTRSLALPTPARPSGQLVGWFDKRGSCLGAQQRQQLEMQAEIVSAAKGMTTEREIEKVRGRVGKREGKSTAKRASESLACCELKVKLNRAGSTKGCHLVGWLPAWVVAAAATAAVKPLSACGSAA